MSRHSQQPEPLTLRACQPVELTGRPSVDRNSPQRVLRVLLLGLACLGLLSGTGCSIRKLAANRLGDALSAGGSTFASDDDPDLVRDAVPFSLKLMEALLSETPKHRGLQLATASGFTQYAFAFVQLPAEELENKDLDGANAMRQRARRLFLRAREHGLRGLEVAHPDFAKTLRADPKTAVAQLSKTDVPMAYWTAASWAAAIAIMKDNADLIADLPLIEALIDRALALAPDYGDGALHSFLISYEMSRRSATGDAAERSRLHFERAVELSHGQQAAPFVAYAESVAISRQDRTLFDSLIKRALAVDPDARPEWRLVNLVMQRRARWLAARADDLILPPLPPEDKK